MNIMTKPLAEITREAIGVLCREIGTVNTLRFVNQFTVGYGNYTEEREVLFGVSHYSVSRDASLLGGMNVP